jgi:integrase
LTTGKDGSERVVIESPYFIAKYRDGAGLVREVATGCRDETAARQMLADLERKAELVRSGVMTASEDAVARRTRNCYRDDLVTFCNWCVETDRLTGNPFAGIGKLNQDTDRRRQRRAMTEDELQRLLDVARRRPLLDALTIRKGKRKGDAGATLKAKTVARLELLGRERALIYKTLVLTGLRIKELASLTAGQLTLDGPVAFAALDAADEKNREGNEIALRDDLADDLRDWLAFKLNSCRQRPSTGMGRFPPGCLPIRQFSTSLPDCCEFLTATCATPALRSVTTGAGPSTFTRCGRRSARC